MSKDMAENVCCENTPQHTAPRALGEILCCTENFVINIKQLHQHYHSQGQRSKFRFCRMLRKNCCPNPCLSRVSVTEFQIQGSYSISYRANIFHQHHYSLISHPYFILNVIPIQYSLYSIAYTVHTGTCDQRRRDDFELDVIKDTTYVRRFISSMNFLSSLGTHYQKYITTDLCY